jgi:RHS repeat-associated protein
MAIGRIGRRATRSNAATTSLDQGIRGSCLEVGRRELGSCRVPHFETKSYHAWVQPGRPHRVGHPAGHARHHHDLQRRHAGSAHHRGGTRMGPACPPRAPTTARRRCGSPATPPGGWSACSVRPTAAATATTCSTGSDRSSSPPTCPAPSWTATPTSPYGEQINPRAGDTNPWRYVSGYHDTATGMIKFGQRYYMPDLARWTQPDPETGTPTGPMSLNAYSYVGCNPINYIDPTGTTCHDILVSFAVVGGLLEGQLILGEVLLGAIGLSATVVTAGVVATLAIAAIVGCVMRD